MLSSRLKAFYLTLSLAALLVVTYSTLEFGPLSVELVAVEQLQFDELELDFDQESDNFYWVSSYIPNLTMQWQGTILFKYQPFKQQASHFSRYRGPPIIFISLYGYATHALSNALSIDKKLV